MKRKFDAKLFDNPPRPAKGSVLLFDTKTTSLAMRVPAKGTPALQVIARDPDGIERRVTFATVVPHGAITPDGRKLDLEGIRTAAVAVRDLVLRGEAPAPMPIRHFPNRDRCKRSVTTLKFA